MEITIDFLKRAINSRHLNYNEIVREAEKLKVHADGRVPQELIFCRRPSEPEEIKAYRAKIYVPKTKNPINKVFNSLEKIRRSQDWVINYDDEKTPARIMRGETLKDYCEYNYPIHTSITNWMFSEGMRQYMLDANGVFAVIPYHVPEKSSEYIKPIITYYDSKQVIDFVDDEYVILKSLDSSVYKNELGNRTINSGEVYIVLTDTEYVRLEQTGVNKVFSISEQYTHNIGRLPAFRAGGVFWKRQNNATLYNSRIASMIPSLDEAAREYSDLQAEIVQHIHSEKYAYTNTECPECHGAGKNKDNKSVCSNCDGAGSVLNHSPYGMHLVTTGRKLEDYQLPTPPIGYIQKSTEIAKLQDERVRQHLYDALSTLNMEFLAETPLNQSGTAKEVDKDELNNFVNGIAEDVVRIMDNGYYLINEYRYNGIVENKDDRIGMLPSINVPTKYDILSSSFLLAELKAAQESKISPTIRRALEVEYAKKKFNTDLQIANEAELCFELDPLYGLSEDEKMTRKSNGGITDTDYIISCNITQFVQAAMSESPEFYRLKNAEKRAKMLIMAKEKATQINNVPEDMTAGL